mmetsp:Transcript_13496/g.21588  ORF Transcript_13496/g.21588 Transcript_13496/m.21588 type:complete len:199 (-) Transcript_13496:105-701(-)
MTFIWTPIILLQLLLELNSVRSELWLSPRQKESAQHRVTSMYYEQIQHMEESAPAGALNEARSTNEGTANKPLQQLRITMMPKFCVRMQDFVRGKLSLRKKNEQYKPTPQEVSGFLASEKWDVSKAVQRLTKKREWKGKLGKLNIAEVAPSFRSNGYSVCLEGLRSREGLPIIYSHGMPLGNVESITKQTAYVMCDDW